MSTFLFCAYSSSLGRFEIETLPDQTLMELFMQDCPDLVKMRFQDYQGDYRDICTWDFVDCDESDTIQEIAYECAGREQRVNIAYLPRSIKRFSLIAQRGRKFAGSADLTQLPDSLEDFSIEGNSFFGEVSLESLPESLQQLYLNENNFEGTVNLCKLPAGLCKLDIYDNYFERALNLEMLPAALETLDVSKDAFDGEISLKHLPEALVKLNISKTLALP